MHYLKQHYGPAEGPLGFPQTDKQARALDELLRSMPRGEEYRYRKTVIEKATSELSAGERADVSWISTEDPDRQGEVVLARGMDDSQFALNPIVTLNHCYWAPPAGKSLWRRRVRNGSHAGIKAKTCYPALPAAWPPGKDWLPDVAFALVQADLLRGKSIGFLPVKVHTPTDEERRQPGWQEVRLVIDAWLLLEYACVFLPAQQNAVVEQVSKSFSPDVLPLLGLTAGPEQRSPVPELIPHYSLETAAAALNRAVERVDFLQVADECLQARLDRMRGRI